MDDPDEKLMESEIRHKTKLKKIEAQKQIAKTRGTGTKK